MLVQTSENSSFGDPTDGLPPGRRSIFDGNTFNENGVDGVQLVATEDSRVLVEITSNRDCLRVQLPMREPIQTATQASPTTVAMVCESIQPVAGLTS